MRRAPLPVEARPENANSRKGRSALPRPAEAAATSEATTAAKAAAAGRASARAWTRRPAARTPARPCARLDRGSLARQQSLALGALARQLAGTAHRFCL